MPVNRTFKWQPHATCTAHPAAAQQYQEIIPWCMGTLSSRCSWDYVVWSFGSGGEADLVM